MKRLFIVGFVLPILTSAAMAADTAVTVAPETISSLLSIVGTALVAGALWLIRKLPAQIVAILMTMRVDQMLARAVDAGINAVIGATKDKPLTFDVGNQVVAKALQYVFSNGPTALISWMGGEALIREKIIARLNVAQDVALK